MVGWKIRVRSERPTPSAGPDDSARVAQRQRLQHIGRGIQDCGAGIPARNPCGHRFHTLWRNSPNASRSEEHTSELQSLMRISYAVFCLKKTNTNISTINTNQIE